MSKAGKYGGTYAHDDITNCVFKRFENEKFVEMKKKILNDGIEEKEI